MGAGHRHKAVLDILQHRQRIAFSRIAPATTTGGNHPHDVAILQCEIVPKGRDVPFLRRARVHHKVATLARFATFDAPGRAFDTVHARAQDGLGGEHADVAYHAGPTAECARATAVLMDGIIENLHREFTLDELDGEVFLTTRRIDDIQAIAEGTRALTDADT